MIVDGSGGSDAIQTDICIVGGGPAGIALALRAAREKTIGICLLESGGLSFEDGVQQLAHAEAVGAPTPSFHESSIRALGGSTWSWGGNCAPLEDSVFEERPWLPASGWPFRRDELDRYRMDALELCGIPRDRADDSVARQLVSTGDDAPIVFEPVYMSRPLRFGAAYRQKLAASSNVRVYLHSTITNVEATGDRIAAVNGWSGGRPIRVVAREFVLACGGIGNARLLLASGLGGDLVGRYFNDHPRVVDRVRVRPGRTGLWRMLTGDRGRRSTPVGLGLRIQRSEHLLNWRAAMTLRYAAQTGSTWGAVRRLAIALRQPWNESPYFQDAGGGRLRLTTRDVAAALRRPHRALIAGASAVVPHPALVRWLEISSALEQAPDPASRVELMSERDPLGMPRVRVHWKIGELEARTYSRARELLLAHLSRLEPGIATRRLTTDSWPSGVTTTWHHLGTTRLATSPADGVVDADCRVHGLANLYVAGSSVFPTSGAAAPTLTIVQLALRLADHLVERERAAPAIEPSGSTRR